MPQAATTSLSDTDSTAPRASNPMADLAFDALYSAAVGGSVMALFFLVVDLLSGRPLFTPSLIGTVLFTHVSPAVVTDVRLNMVAYFSIVHFVSFTVLGAGISLLCRWTGLTGRPPAFVAAVLFAVLTAASLATAALAMPGVVEAVGAHVVLLANLTTAAAMAVFLRWAHDNDSRGAASYEAITP